MKLDITKEQARKILLLINESQGLEGLTIGDILDLNAVSKQLEAIVRSRARNE